MDAGRLEAGEGDTAGEGEQADRSGKDETQQANKKNRETRTQRLYRIFLQYIQETLLTRGGAAGGRPVEAEAKVQ